MAVRNSVVIRALWFCKVTNPTLIYPSIPHSKRLSYKSIPRSPSVPIIGSLPYFLRSGGQTYLPQYIDKLHRKLGPIFVDKMLGRDLVFIADADANMQVYRAEGKYPEHYTPEAWVLYLEKTDQKRGLFFMDGCEWLKTRQILNKILLRPSCLEPYLPHISEVSKEFVDCWLHNPPGENLEYLLYSWSIECLGKIAFGTRLGFIDKLTLQNFEEVKYPERASKEDEFVNAVYNIFRMSADMYVYPVRLLEKFKTKSWTKFYDAVSTAIEIGKAYVEQGIEDFSKGLNEDKRNSLLYKLLFVEKIDKKTVAELLVDLFFASSDTSTHAAAWSLYLLGRNPDKAKTARAEIEETIGAYGGLTPQALDSMAYMKGIIKESMRLYPIASFLTRKTVEPISVLGFDVPPGTMVISSIYTMGRDPKNFTCPHEFLPERWIRKTRLDTSFPDYNHKPLSKHNSKAYVPFGLGARSCVGKRIAEMELSVLIIHALLTFDWTVAKDVEMVQRMVSVPKTEINLQLKRRT